MSTQRIIGLDLDNTIIDYSGLLAELAAPFVGTNVKGKREIRDAIWEHYSDHTWNIIQGQMYGSRISEAALSEGLEEFLDKCLTAQFDLRIISHKSQYAKVDPERTDLRVAAFSFLKEKGITKYVSEERIYFEDNQDAKVHRIRDQSCVSFVDDLQEVFAHANFPEGTQKILYSPTPHPEVLGVAICKDWREIYNEISMANFKV